MEKTLRYLLYIIQYLIKTQDYVTQIRQRKEPRAILLFLFLRLKELFQHLKLKELFQHLKSPDDDNNLYFI